jgi:hypothetical protein
MIRPGGWMRVLMSRLTSLRRPLTLLDLQAQRPQPAVVAALARGLAQTRDREQPLESSARTSCHRGMARRHPRTRSGFPRGTSSRSFFRRGHTGW